MPFAVSSSGCCPEVCIANTSTVVLAIQVVHGLFNFVFFKRGATLRLHKLLLFLRQAAASKKEPASDFFRQPAPCFSTSRKHSRGSVQYHIKVCSPRRLRE